VGSDNVLQAAAPALYNQVRECTLVLAASLPGVKFLALWHSAQQQPQHPGFR